MRIQVDSGKWKLKYTEYDLSSVSLLNAMYTILQIYLETAFQCNNVSFCWSFFDSKLLHTLFFSQSINGNTLVNGGESYAHPMYHLRASNPIVGNHGFDPGSQIYRFTYYLLFVGLGLGPRLTVLGFIFVSNFCCHFAHL